MAQQYWSVGTPESLLICGGAGMGKSTFVLHLLTSPQCWQKKIDKFLYCYGIYTKTVEELSKNYPHIQLLEGLPRNLLSHPLEVLNPQDRHVLVLDDCSLESQESKELTSFLSRGVTHSNTTLISVEHFLFSPSAQRRNQSFHYNQLILFKSGRNLGQLAVLAKQTGICSAKTLTAAYQDATQKPYSHLLIDQRPQTPDQLRLLTNVLCQDGEPTFAYSSSTTI